MTEEEADEALLQRQVAYAAECLPPESTGEQLMAGTLIHTLCRLYGFEAPMLALAYCVMDESRYAVEVTNIRYVASHDEVARVLHALLGSAFCSLSYTERSGKAVVEVSSRAAAEAAVRTLCATHELAFSPAGTRLRTLKAQILTSGDKAPPAAPAPAPAPPVPPAAPAAAPMAGEDALMADVPSGATEAAEAPTDAPMADGPAAEGDKEEAKEEPAAEAAAAGDAAEAAEGDATMEVPEAELKAEAAETEAA